MMTSMKYHYIMVTLINEIPLFSDYLMMTLMVTIIYMYHDDLNEMPLHNDYLNEISFILTACTCMHVHARC